MSNLEVVARVRNKIEAIMKHWGRSCDRSCQLRADGLRAP